MTDELTPYGLVPLGVAERWVGSCRRELLDHAIGLAEREHAAAHHDGDECANLVAIWTRLSR